MIKGHSGRNVPAGLFNIYGRLFTQHCDGKCDMRRAVGGGEIQNQVVDRIGFMVAGEGEMRRTVFAVGFIGDPVDERRMHSPYSSD